MSTDQKTWEPGIYENVPFSEYLGIDAVSNTRLGLMERSPAHYRACVELERTKPLVVGQLIHCGRLEPLALAERYAVMPDFHLDQENKTTDGKQSTMTTTRYFKERSAEFLRANGDKEVVAKCWYSGMVAVVRSLHAHGEANQLFNAPGVVELTIVWDDDETGLLCKARLDKVCPSLGAFADLKSCAELDAFERSIARYAYHRQAAFYQEGWAQHTGELLTPWIVAVEKSPPNCVLAAPLDEDTLSRGAERFRTALNRIAECTATNHWPGPPSPASWRVPQWELDSGDPIELIHNGSTLEV